MDNLDRFQKLVLTQWTFSISISIGLERRDPQAYVRHFFWERYFLQKLFQLHFGWLFLSVFLVFNFYYFVKLKLCELEIENVRILLN